MDDLLNNLSNIPDWDDDKFKTSEESGESWKTQPLKDASRALYEQWQQVMVGINSLFASVDVEDEASKEFWEDQKMMLLADAYQIAVKIQSTASAEMYVLQMENAAIIRKNAIFISGQLLSFAYQELVEIAHAEAVRADVQQFRLLFRQWISFFKKDEFEDDWGIFV